MMCRIGEGNGGLCSVCVGGGGIERNQSVSVYMCMWVRLISFRKRSKVPDCYTANPKFFALDTLSKTNKLTVYTIVAHWAPLAHSLDVLRL